MRPHRLQPTRLPSPWDSPGKNTGCLISHLPTLLKGHADLSFPGGSVVKNLSANVGDLGSIHGSGRSPGEGNGNPLQYSWLGNPMDRGAWWATVHGVEKESDRTWQLNSNDIHFFIHSTSSRLYGDCYVRGTALG